MIGLHQACIFYHYMFLAINILYPLVPCRTIFDANEEVKLVGNGVNMHDHMLGAANHLDSVIQGSHRHK